jgi:hypothetical protein
MFVCVQHLLGTTGSLFEKLIELGAEPNNIFILGKCYSTNQSVLGRLLSLGVHGMNSHLPEYLGSYKATMRSDIDALWRTVSQQLPDRDVDRVIVMDDGGQCFRSVPAHIRSLKTLVGIEQTSSGLWEQPDAGYPVIEVASCAAKRFLEPPLIAEAVCARIGELFLQGRKQRCGVIGFGQIGRAVAVYLAQNGSSVSVYDIRDISREVPLGMRISKSLHDLLDASDLVFGCAGNDVLRSPEQELEGLTGRKVFVSCSSGDTEYNTLLRRIGEQDSQLAHEPLGTIRTRFPHENLELIIRRGGFPLNFDGTEESVGEDIQLTRGLLLGAVLQALQDLPTRPHREMLAPQVQQFVVNSWRRHRRLERYPVQTPPNLPDFARLESIASASGGVYPIYQELDASFSGTTSIETSAAVNYHSPRA